jgi:DNA-binding CsgD family transcriptional regulator
MQVARRGGASVEGRARALSFGNSLFDWPKSKLEFFHARRARGMRAEKRSSYCRFKHFQCTADNLSSELALDTVGSLHASELKGTSLNNVAPRPKAICAESVLGGKLRGEWTGRDDALKRCLWSEKLTSRHGLFILRNEEPCRKCLVAVLMPRFTTEESILLRSLATGNTVKEMAGQLRLPRESLFRLLSDLRRKTGVADDTALAVWVLRNMRTGDRRGSDR